MAERPIFVPTTSGRVLVNEVPVRFTWHPGMSAVQKKKNVAALHRCAESLHGLHPVLEISSKSDIQAGVRLSAFNLQVEIAGIRSTVESVFQGSKVFEHGGPFIELYGLDSRSAKRDERLRTSGKLIGFRIEGRDYPLNPKTVFYDWLYITALLPHREWLTKLKICAGFTDIEYNPERQFNCQARSCATFLALEYRNGLDQAMSSFEDFKSALEASAPEEREVDRLAS